MGFKHDQKEGKMTRAPLSWLLAGLLTLTLVSVGCSDDDTDPGNKDGGGTVTDSKVTPADKSGLPDGYKLWPCKTPGTECNAHDPCAINAVCGVDKLCRPQKLQNCDDGLKCTVDTCAGLGVCKNTPIKGTCALAVLVPKGKTCDDVKGGKVNFDAGVPPTKGDGGTADAGTPDMSTVEKETIFCCWKKGERKPGDQCLECNPETGDDSGTGGNSRKWSPANGGSCDDGNLCTKNDYCQYGQCKGTSFASLCSDGYGCTLDICDGKGGCLGNKMKPGFCLINATCYKTGAMHPGGSCFTCDPTKNVADWSPVGSSCLISGKCYKAGDKDTTGCNQCDPKTSTTSWTPVTGVCSIKGKCYKPKDKHTGKCAECDPKTSQTAWTVIGTGDCLISNKCYKAKATDTTGCKECNPTKNKYDWSAVAGLCAISSKCYKPKDKHSGGCAECDPTKNATGWTVNTTTDCLISNKCYKAQAKDTTGCNECDPTKNKYDWSSVKNTCLVSGKCYSQGAKHSGGCASCQPANNAKGWTANGQNCLISDTCYKAKAKDSTGCGECDPTKTKYGWTVTKASSCLIGGTCYSSGASDPTKCATCDPTKSTTTWTPSSNKCLILGDCMAAKKNDSSGCLQCKVSSSKSSWTGVGGTKISVEDFNSGKAAGWTIKNAVTTVGWQVSSNRKYEGKYSLYYGNPTAKNYSASTKNSGSATSPAITLASGKKAGLHIRLYMDVESFTSYDKFKIFVNSTKVWEKGVNSSTMKKWLKVNIDLAKYAGKSITIKYDFDSVDTVSNTTEGIFVDAQVIYHGC